MRLPDIVSGSLYKIPIHIEQFVYQGGVVLSFPGGDRAEIILGQDLRYSDFFTVSLGSFASGPGGDIIPEGTRAIASASIGSSWGRPVLSGTLRDAKTQNKIFSRDYPLGDPPDRWAIHAFSDDIVLYMTGERGIAETRIAFIQEAGQNREIHLIDYDGANQQQLTRFGTIVLSPAFSPTGDRLAFTTFAPGQAGVAGYRIRDGRTWNISQPGAMSASPAWSPDGQQVAFTRSLSGNLEIFVANAEGGDPTRLTYNPSIDTSPSFSPDGRRIAFTSDRSGHPEVYVMDRDGASARRITFYGSQNDSPDWSPKGDRIAFVSMLDGVFDICTVRPDGSDLVRLTGDEGTHENPRWAPDGRHLVYSKLQGGRRSLYVMASDGSGKRALTSGRSGQYNPAWSPQLSLESSRGPSD
ncbi:MAG: Tol-Pal system beta propeller repeat protein TolB [Candidatus Eisenbacteria bacterium]|nr:Tol-Pal system beta propeller repeat protein TolB [Candidatus Eisenbacteria bacterium]